MIGFGFNFDGLFSSEVPFSRAQGAEGIHVATGFRYGWLLAAFVRQNQSSTMDSSLLWCKSEKLEMEILSSPFVQIGGVCVARVLDFSFPECPSDSLPLLCRSEKLEMESLGSRFAQNG